MTGVNVTQAVVVLGDSATADRVDMLAERAAENGMKIAKTFAFEPGAGAAHDDITDIDAVIQALSRAISTNASVWLPFPVEDLAREQHWRRLSIVLQRHGLNLLMGRSMDPCPVEGGYSHIDAALRAEVKAIDELDNAALAAAGQRTLTSEIEAALAAATRSRACRGERIYSTREVADLLGKSPTWITWAVREQFLTYSDESPIEPLRVGRSGRRRYTGAMLRQMARSCRKRGVINRREYERVLDELTRTEGLR